MNSSVVFKGKIPKFAQTNPLFALELSGSDFFSHIECTFKEYKCGPILYSAAIKGEWKHVALEGSPYFVDTEVLIEKALINEISKITGNKNIEDKIENLIISSINTVWNKEIPSKIEGNKSNNVKSNDIAVICSEFSCTRNVNKKSMGQIRILQPAANFDAK